MYVCVSVYMFDVCWCSTFVGSCAPSNKSSLRQHPKKILRHCFASNPCRRHLSWTLENSCYGQDHYQPMKRVFKISDTAQAELFCFAKTKTLTSSPFIFTLTKSPNHLVKTRDLNVQTQNPSKANFYNIVRLFLDKFSSSNSRAREDLRNKVAQLKLKLVLNIEDTDKIAGVLKENGVSLFRSYSDGSACVELLKQLSSWPYLALEVFFPDSHLWAISDIFACIFFLMDLVCLM